MAPPLKKFAKCIWQSHLLRLQVNPLAPPRRLSPRVRYFKYAQFVPCLDEIWGLLGAIRTAPPPSTHAQFACGIQAGLSTVKLPRPLHFTDLWTQNELPSCEENTRLTSELRNGPINLGYCGGFKAKGAHIKMAIHLLCNMFLDENDWTESWKPLVDIRVCALTGHSRVETVGFITFFQCRSLTETLSHTLTLNHFFFWQLQRFRRDAKPVSSPWPDCRSARLACTPVLPFKPLKKTCKNGPVWVSGWPVPPRAARCSSGLPPRSLSGPTPLFKPASHSDQLAGPWRQHPQPANQTRTGKIPADAHNIYAGWRSGKSTNDSADIYEKKAGNRNSTQWEHIRPYQAVYPLTY